MITLDWPGQGRSAEDATGTAATAERYADILEDALAQVLASGAKPIVIGNSIGGAAAIVLAARRPEFVAGLVLCNPGGLAPLDPISRAVCALMVAFFRAGEH